MSTFFFDTRGNSVRGEAGAGYLYPADEANQRLQTAEMRIVRLEMALKKISEPEGAWNQSMERYYKNIIDEMIAVARAALDADEEAPE